MKRTYVIAFVLAFMLIATSASAVDMMLGLKGGVNIAGVYGEATNEGKETRLGFIGGASLDFKVHKMFSVQPELLFANKGWKRSEGNDEAVWKIDYFEIPVLIKFHIPANEVADPYIYLGPAVGINVTGTLEVTEDGETDSRDFKDNLTSADFSIVGGAGVDIMVGEKGAVIIEVRVDTSLSTFDSADDPDDIKNYAIGAMIGYGFKF
jgi:hypothetical protein